MFLSLFLSFVRSLCFLPFFLSSFHLCCFPVFFLSFIQCWHRYRRTVTLSFFLSFLPSFFSSFIHSFYIDSRWFSHDNGSLVEIPRTDSMWYVHEILKIEDGEENTTDHETYDLERMMSFSAMLAASNAITLYITYHIYVWNNNTLQYCIRFTLKHVHVDTHTFEINTV